MPGLAEGKALCREFVFAGNLKCLGDARDAILDFVREHCADQDVELDILLASQEALANAILHGCLNDERPANSLGSPRYQYARTRQLSPGHCSLQSRFLCSTNPVRRLRHQGLT